MMTRNPTAPTGASTTAQFEMREVHNTWAGPCRILPVVPARFELRRGGGWRLTIAHCPYCGSSHSHSSGRPPVWDARDNSNPLVYAQQPKYAHCDGGTSAIYVLEIVAGLPTEVR